MADDNKVKKVVGDQSVSDRLFIKKAETFQLLKSKKLATLKTRNNMIGLLLAGGVLGISPDGYTIFAVRQGKLMDDFDKTPQ